MILYDITLGETMSKVVILGINASPRLYGNTYKLLRIALEGAKDAGAVTKIINLYDYKIKPCLGCVSDERKACRYPCVIQDDDMKELYDLILHSDGFVIATPVYWFNVPGVLKNLVDRLTALENMIVIDGRCWIEGKVAGVIAVGDDSGVITVISNLFATLNSMGIIIPPWALAYINSRIDAFNSKNAILDSYNLGRNVALMAKIVKQSGIKVWYFEKVERINEIIQQVKREVEENYKLQASKRRKLIMKFLEMENSA